MLGLLCDKAGLSIYPEAIPYPDLSNDDFPDLRKRKQICCFVRVVQLPIGGCSEPLGLTLRKADATKLARFPSHRCWQSWTRTMDEVEMALDQKILEDDNWETLEFCADFRGGTIQAHIKRKHQ